MPATASSHDRGRALQSPPDPPLRIEGLVKRFGRTAVISGLDLRVGRGEVVALVGANGCGKTTTLCAVAGLVRPDTGSIAVAGSPAGTLDARRSLAFVPDVPGGFDELTVLEHVRLVALLHRSPAGGDAAGEPMLERFGLADRRHERLGTLSLGLRRRVAAAAALALSTPLVLVDEATAALDPATVATLGRELRERAARGAGVLLATQDLGFVHDVCDRAVVLDGEGRGTTGSGRLSLGALPPALLARAREGDGGAGQSLAAR